ncbi:LOW QUALITY PROTEIN: putative serine protease 46 [Erethizon dorsatum]
MACGSGDLQAHTPLLPSVRLENQPYRDNPWSWACGHTNVSREVVPGKLVEVGRWPWQVTILFLRLYLCSGSLIHQWVLTAAHCLQRSKHPKQYFVNVGAQHLPDARTQLPLSHIVIHEDFTDLISQDIALLKLKDPISWSLPVQPICLPPRPLKPTVGSMCWMIGWGRPGTKGECGAPKNHYPLQEVATRIIDNHICNQEYQLLAKGQKKLIGDDMLCTSLDSGLDSCQVWNDISGSSLACQVNKTWIQMGVLSWSFGCGQRDHFPVIYTSTSHFAPWIEKQMARLNSAGRACAAFLSLLLMAGHTLLVSLLPLWLL